MNRIERALLLSVPLGFLVVEVIALATAAPIPLHRFLDGARGVPFFVIATIAIAFFSLERKQVVPLFALGTAFEVVHAIVLERLFDTPFADALLMAGPGFWYASLCLSGWQALQSEGAARARALDVAAIKFALPGSVPLTMFALWLTGQVLPQTYDSFLYAFDGLLPLPVADIAGRAFAANPGMSQAFTAVYHSFMLVACLFMVSWGNGRLSGWLISRWIVAALFGCGLYFVMPAIGPAIAFDATYPQGLPDPAAVPLALFPTSSMAARNAMPSLHTTWALLIAIIAWRSGRIARIVASMNLAATVIATLGMREHYLIDLIVAVPFTVAVHGLVSWCDAGGRRSHAAAAAIGGAILTAAWLLTIGFGIGPLRSAPWMASVLVLGTMIASGWLLCRLERGAEPGATRFGRPWEQAIQRTIGRQAE
jgi:hypothetical protein